MAPGGGTRMRTIFQGYHARDDSLSGLIKETLPNKTSDNHCTQD